VLLESAEVSQARFQESTLGGLARQLEGALVGCPRRLGETESSLHVGARGVGEVVTIEAALSQHSFDSREPSLGPIAHAEGSGAVQSHYR